jgi:uncharacterized sulfatase
MSEENRKRKLSRRDFIKGALVAGGALLVTGYGVKQINNSIQRDYDPKRSQAVLASIDTAQDKSQLPNIVLIFTDDLGYGDLDVFGSKAIETPVLHKMADEGVMLTHFYSAASLCSPSRAGLLTGRYPIRTMVTGSLYPSGSPMNLVMSLAGFYTNGVRGIPEDELLLPEMLKARGYKTGMLGKWHLGDTSPHLPNDNGFDFFYGALYSNNMNPYRIYRNRNVEIDEPVDQNLLTQNITREAMSFIHDNKNEPFFLYIAHPMPHEPIHASPGFRGQSNGGLYGDAVQEIDWSVGQILNQLSDDGLRKNTLVIFTSDNGPWWQGSPGFKRGRKNLPFEGGYLVPLIAQWPGVLPVGMVSDGMSMSIDLYATILKIAGVPIPNDRIVDGKDIFPFLKGEEDSPHDRLFFFKGNKLIGVRFRDWKYMRRHMTDNGGYTTLSQGPFLFNLARDPNESYSLIESEPEMAKFLRQLLDQFDQELENNLRGWQ